MLFIAAIKTEIIEELEKHRDAELAEQREKRHKAEAEKARKNAEQSTNTDEAKVCFFYTSAFWISLLLSVRPVSYTHLTLPTKRIV